MLQDIEFWRLVAGLGLFLFGMSQLEKSLSQLAGRSVKIFLREHTAHPLKGAMAGALATAILQSSSVVGLIVLALAGASVISLASALGIVFGSNLGTTATGWIVATFGFKLDIEAVSLPLVGLGGLGVVWSASGSRRAGFSYLIAGFGLMLLGLSFMKSGASDLASWFRPELLQGYPLVVLLLAGLVLTAAIQSSSATIMITLSALYAGVIELPAAAAVAIGADLGTTGTVLLGALRGSPVKKQITAGLLLFNLVADLLGFVFLHPLLHFITGYLGITDPLFALVGFHSLINLIGLTIFVPLTRPLSRILERRLTSSRNGLLRHIAAGEVQMSEIAVDNIGLETRRLVDQACALNQMSLELRPANSFYASEADRKGSAIFSATGGYTEQYALLKQLEGGILSYVLSVQEMPLGEPESERLGQLIPAIRNAVHSVKCIKDIRHDLQSFRDSPDDALNAYFAAYQTLTEQFYTMINTLRSAAGDAVVFELLADLHAESDQLHSKMHSKIYSDASSGRLAELEISTLLNVNRELLMSNRSLLSAIANAVLPVGMSESFAGLPATA